MSRDFRWVPDHCGWLDLLEKVGAVNILRGFVRIPPPHMAIMSGDPPATEAPHPQFDDIDVAKRYVETLAKLEGVVPCPPS
jgi:hypothetical protein